MVVKTCCLSYDPYYSLSMVDIMPEKTLKAVPNEDADISGSACLHDRLNESEIKHAYDIFLSFCNLYRFVRQKSK